MTPVGKPTEREALAFKLKQAGATFDAIGTHLGVSRSQAHVLTKKYSARMDEVKSCPSHDAVKFLGCTVVDMLLSDGIDIKDENAHIEVSKMHFNEVKKLPHVGKVGFDQVEEWLAHNGLSLFYPIKSNPKEKPKCPHCGKAI